MYQQYPGGAQPPEPTATGAVTGTPPQTVVRAAQVMYVGIAASVGAGISMGFAEALSDDGSLTGRGRPWTRGFVCGGMTALGGLGHTLPYLIPSIKTATSIAVGVVLVELSVISWIRHKFMDTPLLSALLQVLLGGALVFLAGVSMAPVFPTTLAIVGTAFPQMTGTAIGFAITCGWAGLAVSSRIIGAIAGGDPTRLRKALLIIPASAAVMIVLNLAIQSIR